MSSAARAPFQRDTTELLSIMIDAVEDYAIYMLGLDGTVLTWNKGAQRNKGYTADEIVGQNYACFFPPEARAAALRRTN